MTKSYRIRTQPGIDKNIRLNVNQDFDFLEILSLKLKAEDVYTRFCADYGVVAGRVIVNGGFGVPNVTLSIFVPLDSVDENDIVISTLYPYKTPQGKNEDGYRYNLLPYIQEYGGHTPTGTFPSRNDVLSRTEVLEVYEKYYKYTVKTNESGDFMIIGVPLGIQTIVMDLDLSNIGTFSLRPADLIREGLATAEQFDGDKFKSSTDLASLPQIINSQKDIDVTSFWGEEDLCNIGITRVDFDLRDLGINIKPHVIFMGSIFSTTEEDFLKTNCKPKKDTGNLCDLVSAPGSILAIRQTIDYDVDGRPVLEQYILPEGGKIIDDSGTWLTEVPMNLNYVYTNEFGEQVLSNDPAIGIPTKAKYRFRIQYQNESGMESSIMRGDYLVPNIKEWGWSLSNENEPTDSDAQMKSYAFSLDWNDYGDTGTTIGVSMINEAINGSDRFYEFNYNKVYTVSSFLDRWKWGTNRYRHLGIKEITNRSCATTTNRFPVNDGVRNFNTIFFLFNIIISILTPAFISIMIILHVLALLYPVIRVIIDFFIKLINLFYDFLCNISSIKIAGWKPFERWGKYCDKPDIPPLSKENPFKRISIPMMSYPDCEACSCEDEQLPEDDSNSFTQSYAKSVSALNTSLLANSNSVDSFGNYEEYNTDGSVAQGLTNAAREIFAGYQFKNNGTSFEKLVKIPYGDPGTPFIRTIGQDVNLSQSLNIINLRNRYFSYENIIKTTVKNYTPNTTTEEPSQPFTDNVLILLCDTGTLAYLTTGKLVTFYNPQSVNDPNLTGLTTANQFNTNSITGTCSVNTSSLVTKTITYIKPDGNLGTSNLKLKILEGQKDYKFTAGIEYFQVITGATMSEFSGLINGSNGIIKKYIIDKTQKWDYVVDDPLNNRISRFINAFDNLQNSLNLNLVILNKGVDPYTEKQRIEYDLSKLFGFNFGLGPKVIGDYHINIPIQPNTGSGAWYNDYKTPESHNVTNNTNTSLFHKSYSFTIDTTQFSSFTSNNIYYYNSTDKSKASFKAYSDDPDDLKLSRFATNGVSTSADNVMKLLKTPSTSQNNVEGGSLFGSLGSAYVYSNPQYLTDNIYKYARAFSPAYHTTSGNLTMTNNNRLVLRTDRLPTSDGLEIRGNNSFSLHLNDNFAIYTITDQGQAVVVPVTVVGSTDSTGNAADAAGGASDALLQTLTCENMTVLDCYQGSGTNFSVVDPCEANEDNKRMKGGCYLFVQPPFILTIPKDIKYFGEWKARFRMMFGACQGIFGHVFQNNWVNGSLYMFAFKKQTLYTITGQPKKYKFCGSQDSTLRPGQGPIFYTRGVTNSMFYRSTPYDSTNFIGQKPRKKDAITHAWESSGYDGTNVRNLFSPTTIMDLGPRDEFTKEISSDPQFLGYNVNTLKTTSFNDTSDLLQLFILSRLVSTGFLAQMLSLGDASINRMFSRTDDRMDGDAVQMFSINSEYNVEGFDDDEYNDNDIFVGQDSNGDALFGVFFRSSSDGRKKVSPGLETFTTTLSNYYGFPNSQVVPMYQWKNNDTSSIFGKDTNDWETDISGGGFYKTKYQALSFDHTPITPYFNSTNTGKRGFIYNENSSGIGTATFPQGQASTFIVGAPYHFYFGLEKGKSALNRYITKYIMNQDV